MGAEARRSVHEKELTGPSADEPPAPFFWGRTMHDTENDDRITVASAEAPATVPVPLQAVVYEPSLWATWSLPRDQMQAPQPAPFQFIPSSYPQPRR
jgi:hypothetical protein